MDVKRFFKTESDAYISDESGVEGSALGIAFPKTEEGLRALIGAA